MERKQPQGQARPGHRRQVEAQSPPFEGNRPDHCAETQDEQDVDQGGADYVADRQTRAPLPNGVDADSQLRQTRPERDDREGPTTMGLTPRSEASAAPPRTSRSAPTSSPASPAIMSRALDMARCYGRSCAAAVAASDDVEWRDVAAQS